MSIKGLIKSSFLCLPPLLKLVKKGSIIARKKQLLQEACTRFKEEHPVHGTLSDYKIALNKHFVSYSEYMYQYEFWRLTEQERSKFIARNALSFSVYYDIPWEIKRKFWNKVEFLNSFSQYIHREWLCARFVSFEVFKSFLSRVKECIVKPLDNCCGVGIYKINYLVENQENLQFLYYQCVTNNVLLEECIKGAAELQSFHSQSLNTIRVVTVKGRVFGAFFRMGKGNSVIDNAHAGGIFAQINVDSGIIESEGIDADGGYYVEHPDTHKQIKGFVIPHWEEIKAVCIDASRIVPENPITGWDVVINQAGDIEFVEGNHGPDFDVMQSPLKIGVKEILYKLLGKTCQ